MHDNIEDPSEIIKDKETESSENLKMKLFIANYMLKNPKAKPREIRRATEKEFKTKIQ